MSRKKVSTTIYITPEQADHLRMLHERTKVPIAVYIREGIDLVGKTFGYRLVSPMTRPQTFTVVPGTDGLDAGAEARSAAGSVCAVSTLTGM